MRAAAAARRIVGADVGLWSFLSLVSKPFHRSLIALKVVGVRAPHNRRASVQSTMFLAFPAKQELAASKTLGIHKRLEATASVAANSDAAAL